MASQRKPGCFIYGCLISSILSIIVAAVIGLYLYRQIRSAVESYTSSTPIPVAVTPVAPDIAKSGEDEITKFFDTAKDPNGSGNFDFTADEINGAISVNPKVKDLLKDRLRVTFPDNEVQVDFSVKIADLGSWPALSWFAGGDTSRYLNGSARGTILTDKEPVEVHLSSLMLNGQNFPKMTLEQASSWMTGALEALVQNQNNDAQSATGTPGEGEKEEVSVTSRLKNFAVKDGHLSISLIKGAPAAP